MIISSLINCISKEISQVLLIVFLNVVHSIVLCVILLCSLLYYCVVCNEWQSSSQTSLKERAAWYVRHAYRYVNSLLDWALIFCIVANEVNSNAAPILMLNVSVVWLLTEHVVIKCFCWYCCCCCCWYCSCYCCWYCCWCCCCVLLLNNATLPSDVIGRPVRLVFRLGCGQLIKIFYFVLHARTHTSNLFHSFYIYTHTHQRQRLYHIVLYANTHI